MDWIDSILEKGGIQFQKMSLRKALWCYMGIAIFATLLAYTVTFTILNGWENMIFQQNSYTITFQKITEGGMLVEDYRREAEEEVKVILTVIRLVQQAVLVLYPVIALCITSHVYYQKKLREPLEKMAEEAAYIGRDDLSLPCLWDTEDEMGKACEAIEKMRRRLVENKKDMWDLMEQQRDLNAAFAHDIRTPLTVMQGYTEMLMQFYPRGKISEEKLLDTLEALNRQVRRLKNFTETMKDIHSMEEIQVKKKKEFLGDLKQKITHAAKGLEHLEEISIEVNQKNTQAMGYFDENVILEVAENLLSNAVRYAKTKVEVQLETEGEAFFLSVKDDGRGFRETELYQAARPYYTDPEEKEEGVHYGLGLTICKILCKKHGGDLALSNSVDGGAIACASFFIQ